MCRISNILYHYIVPFFNSDVSDITIVENV